MCLYMHTFSHTSSHMFQIISSIEHYTTLHNTTLHNTTQHYTIQQYMTECCTMFNGQSIGMRCSDRGSVWRFEGQTRTVRTAWQGVQEGMRSGHKHFIAWHRPHLQQSRHLKVREEQNSLFITSMMYFTFSIWCYYIFLCVFCTALHCTALHCTALNCAALHWTVLHCTELRCTALHWTALLCTTLHCTALLCTGESSFWACTSSPPRTSCDWWK